MSALTAKQAEELAYICSESGVALVPGSMHTTFSQGFIVARSPQTAARLYRMGLLKRSREAERETVGGRWKYHWAYKPTDEGKSALAKARGQQP